MTLIVVYAYCDRTGLAVALIWELARMDFLTIRGPLQQT